MKKIIYLLLVLSIYSCKQEKKEAKEVPAIKVNANYEYINIKNSQTVSADMKGFNINKEYKEILENNNLIDFEKIRKGDKIEYGKLKNFSSDDINFQKIFYGECWESRPKTFRELDYVETKRKSLFKLNETNINLLKIFDILSFNFNNKNRAYLSEINFTGRHICNEKIYKYYISISILYKVKLKKGNITINNLEELGANVSAKKAEVEYVYISKGIQINPNSKETPKYSKTGSGIFNKKAKIELDQKINYFLEEIAKENGAFIGRPFPEKFIFIEQ